MKRLIPITMILVSVICNYLYADHWIQRADVGGMPRADATGFSIGSKGYIGTGYIGTYASDWWEWDQTTNVWTQKANYPGGGIVEASAFSIGLQGYVLSSPTGNDLYRYDQPSNTWTLMAVFPGSARQAAVAFAIDTKGYITTGASSTLGGSLDDLWEYNTTNDTWTQMANLPGVARHYACGFAIGSKGYVGTGQSASAQLLDDLWAWEQSTNTWSQMANFPGTGRREASAFAIGNLGYLGMGSGWGVYNTDFYQYNPATNSWTQKASFSGGPREEATQFSMSPYGYVGTGYDGLAAGVMKLDYWEYHPEDSTTSVAELPNQPSIITIAPNPMVNETMITVLPESKQQIAAVNLFDLSGNLVYTQAVSSNSFFFYRNNLAGGVYTLEVLFGDHSSERKNLVIR